MAVSGGVGGDGSRMGPGDWAAGLALPQFALLSNFTQAPDRPRTVTGIARALRANQPKITNRARQLVKRGYLHV